MVNDDIDPVCAGKRNDGIIARIHPVLAQQRHWPLVRGANIAYNVF
jgi:hypothetical protein